MNLKLLKKYSIFLLFLIISCSKPLDYFGNRVNFNQNDIYLVRAQPDSVFNNIFYLTFALKPSSNPYIELKNPSLQSYLKLLMHYEGYEKMDIVEHKLKGIIQPRLFVKIRYD